MGEQIGRGSAGGSESENGFSETELFATRNRGKAPSGGSVALPKPNLAATAKRDPRRTPCGAGARLGRSRPAIAGLSLRLYSGQIIAHV